LTENRHAARIGTSITWKMTGEEERMGKMTKLDEELDCVSGLPLKPPCHKSVKDPVVKPFKLS
jgi:hypothetical protein